MAGYNGWTNKETWLVNLWLGDIFQSMQDEGEQITADLIEQTVDELVDDETKNRVGFIVDLLNCALGEINYSEIAAFYTEE